MTATISAGSIFPARNYFAEGEVDADAEDHHRANQRQVGNGGADMEDRFADLRQRRDAPLQQEDRQKREQAPDSYGGAHDDHDDEIQQRLGEQSGVVGGKPVLDGPPPPWPRRR